MKNSELAIKELTTKLIDYLDIKGIKTKLNEKISCLNPNHPDFHPSMNIFKDEKSDAVLGYCFSCNQTCNIFHAAHFIEGLPLSGKEFFNITIPTLCNYFGIEYEVDELSEDEREAYTRKRAYRDATNIICRLPKNDDNQIIERIKDRGWTRSYAAKSFIGGVNSFNEFMKQMKNLGWDTDYLKKIDLHNNNLFNSNNLIFAIRNEWGEPVGFVARRVPWTKSSKLSKFENSSNSDIYKKGHILYNLDRAKKIKRGPLYIVEGYPDVNTMVQLGLEKAAGVGGTAFTDSHTELLNKLEIYDLVICMDGDIEGIKATENTLEKLSKYKCFNIKVIEIPFGKDPDDYVKEFSINEFKNLPKLTPFEWMLKHSESTGEELANKTLDIILEERNLINQLDMCKSLSRISGIDLHIIRKEIENRQNWAENTYIQKIRNLKDRCAWRLQKEKTNLKTVLYETIRDHEKIEKAHVNASNEEDEYYERFKNLKERYLSNPSLLGYKVPSFPLLEKALDGIPKTQSLIALAGKANCGKSSFLRYLSYDLVKNNDDLIILYMTIDDNFEKTITPLVAIDQDLDIIQVRKPNNYLIDEAMMDKFNIGWENIMKLQKEKLVIRDVTSGGDLDTLERHINKYQNNYPDKNILVILDNFHKLGGLDGNNRRESIVGRSTRIKEISNTYDIPIIMTVELKKMGHNGRPILEDITESNQIEYDCDIVLLAHNELHINKYTHIKWECNGVDMPYFEIDVAKNKETSNKPMIAYKFTTHKNKFEEAQKEFECDKQKSASVDQIIASARDIKLYEQSKRHESPYQNEAFEKKLAWINKIYSRNKLDEEIDEITNSSEFSEEDKAKLLKKAESKKYQISGRLKKHGK